MFKEFWSVSVNGKLRFESVFQKEAVDYAQRIFSDEKMTVAPDIFIFPTQVKGRVS
jgi:hypothetical protein